MILDAFHITREQCIGAGPVRLTLRQKIKRCLSAIGTAPDAGL
jgi:hypothetical protein